MKSKSFLKEFFLFFIVGLLINIFCVFLFFLPVKASDVVVSGDTPFKYSSILTYNDWASENNLGNAILQSIRSYGLPIDNEDYVLILNDVGFYGIEGNYIIYRAWFYLVPISDFTTYSSNFLTNSMDFDLISNENYYYFGVHFDIKANAFSPIVFNVVTNPNHNDWSMFGHMSQNLNVNNGDFSRSYWVTSLVPFYFNKDFYCDNLKVLDFTEIIDTLPEYTGHAVPPDSFDEPIFPTGHAKPSQVPQLTINNYTWTTPPTPDFSTLEDTAVSLFNYLSWLGSNLIGAFGNLINNIVAVAEYLGKTLQYFLGLILSAIINGITNFYNNMVALIEPFLNYFTEPMDTQAVQETVEDTSIYGLITVGWNFHNTYKDFFDSITQVNSLTFSIPYTIWTQSGYIVVDFSWYDDIRDLILPWIVGFLYSGFGLYIFRSIPSIIHGLSGVMQKGA